MTTPATPGHGPTDPAAEPEPALTITLDRMAEALDAYLNARARARRGLVLPRVKRFIALLKEFQNAEDELVKAEYQLISVTSKLDDHLPAITAALQDAITWRHDGPDECGMCDVAPDGHVRSLCGDHADDQAAAQRYQAALDALTAPNH